MTAAAPTDLLAWLPRLRRYARALVGNPADADDFVQQTLERAWTQAARWPGVVDMRAWLFGIMHHTHVDGLRRARPRTEPLTEAHEPAVPPAHEARLAARQVLAALAHLPPEQREVILLVALEDMRYADVAQALGIPIGTVMSRLARGGARLRELTEGGAGAAARAHLKVVK